MWKAVGTMLLKLRGRFSFRVVRVPTDSILDDIILIYDDADVVLYKGSH